MHPKMLQQTKMKRMVSFQEAVGQHDWGIGLAGKTQHAAAEHAEESDGAGLQSLRSRRLARAPSADADVIILGGDVALDLDLGAFGPAINGINHLG